MAAKLVVYYVHTCDRCNRKESTVPAVTDAYTPKVAPARLPREWGTVGLKDLCPTCLAVVRGVLNGSTPTATE